jgi:hypothetical protein
LKIDITRHINDVLLDLRTINIIERTINLVWKTRSTSTSNGESSSWGDFTGFYSQRTIVVILTFDGNWIEKNKRGAIFTEGLVTLAITVPATAGVALITECDGVDSFTNRTDGSVGRLDSIATASVAGQPAVNLNVNVACFRGFLDRGFRRTDTLIFVSQEAVPELSVVDTEKAFGVLSSGIHNVYCRK